jgi:hypothetical protein
VKRTLTTLTLLSAIAFCVLVVMWPASYFMDLSKSIGTGKLAPSDSILIAPYYRLGFERGSMWLYSYQMPYRGGTVSIWDKNDPPPIIRAWTCGDYGFSHVVRVGKLSERACDLPGIYFRRFWRFDDNPPYTTLCVSLWYPVLLSAVLPFLWFFRRRYP